MECDDAIFKNHTKLGRRGESAVSSNIYKRILQIWEYSQIAFQDCPASNACTPLHILIESQ